MQSPQPDARRGLMRGLVVAVALLLIWPTLILAEQADIPVELKADKLKYYEDSPLVEASGSVEVHLKEVTIYADLLRFDSVTNIATAEGNVRLTGAAYLARAAGLTYDASREISTFRDFRSSAQPAKATSPFYLTAREMTEQDSALQGRDGSATTCEYDDPHFLMTAERLSYYPDDRIEGWNTVMYIGGLPVLWLPYLRYDLAKQKKRNWTLGHNNVEGDFLKSAWSYPAGTLFLDLMSHKGFGYGTEIGYGLAAIGAGTLYLYHLDEKDTGTSDWVTRISDEKKLNDTTVLRFNHRYSSTYLVPSGRLEQTAGGLGLSGTGQDPWNLNLNILDDRGGQTEKYNLQYDRTAGSSNLNYYYNYEFSKTAPNWLNKSQRLAFRSPLFSDHTQLNITADYYHRVNYTGDPGEEKITPQLEITGRETDYSWRYTQNWFVDLRQELSPGVPRYEFLEKQPEIEIAPRALDLKLFNLSSRFGYGYYREVKQIPQTGNKRDFAAPRYQATLNADQSVPLILGTRLNIGAGVDQYGYGPGDQLFGLRENAALQTDLLSFFRNDLSYTHGYNEGNSPFFFDKLNTNYHDLLEQMTFYRGTAFDWSFSGGKNLLAHKWYPVMTRLNIAPDPRFRLTVNTGWDIENTKYKDLITSLHFYPASFFSTDINFDQEMNVGQLRSASALYNIYFLEKQPNQLFLRLAQVYEPASNDFRVRDIMVVKDLHCWEMKATYSDYRKELAVVFSLKAVPSEPFGYAPGRGFYFEGFDQLQQQVQNFRSEGEVRRY